MSIDLGPGSLVTIYGGSGFVGRHLVQALAQRGVRIRVAVRRPDLAGHLQPLGGVGQIHAVQANVRDEDSVRRAATGADAVINLVGILWKSRRQSFDAVHHRGAETIARCAAQAGVGTLVHISAIGADQAARSYYARSKALGEEKVQKNFPAAVILRPAVIFGPEDEFFNRFASLMRLSPLMPAIGGGKTRFQPVYVGDVAKAVLAALEGKAVTHAAYELGGPRIYSFRELLQLTGKLTGRAPRFIYVPFWFAKLKAGFWQLMPWKILTVDQVRQLQDDIVVSPQAIESNRTLQGLGVHPHAVESIIPAYLERFRAKGQYQDVAREY